MACFWGVRGIGVGDLHSNCTDWEDFNTVNDLYMWRIIFVYVKMKKAILE